MKTKLGHMKCPDCPNQVSVRENEHGTLSFSCDECDANGYAKKTAGNNAIWRSRLVPIEKPAAPAQVPAEKKPAAPKKSFDTII